MDLTYLALIAACSALALAWPLRTRAGPAHRQHPGRGHAVVVALIRGFVRRSAAGLGNAWLDLTRATGYVLLLSFLFALFPAGQGVIQNSAPTRTSSWPSRPATRSRRPTPSASPCSTPPANRRWKT